MAISIQTIENKEFRVKPSGYDPDEVDMFLDSIIDEFESMQHEIQQLRAAAARPKPAEPQVPESSEAAQKILVNAQRVSDETIADARKQADMIVAEANDKAENIVEDARREQMRLEDTLNALRSAANDYRERFRRLIDDQAHLLNAETELFK